MIILFIRSSDSNSIEVQLPHANMILDPRTMGGRIPSWFRFSFSVKGRTLTVTRTDQGWDDDFYLRAYLPTDVIPDFTSTIYTYYGLDHEEVPEDVTEVIFAPSVTVVKGRAFYDCSSLVRVTIPDTVTRIENQAFAYCRSLRFIQLSTNLVSIATMAVHGCTSLEAVFLPPTVTYIGDYAFGQCESLRFINVPEAIEHIGEEVFKGCDALLATFNFNWEERVYNQDKVMERLRQRHANFHLHQACSSTSVTSQQIEACIHTHGIERAATEIDDQQMTALHILCLNPHVTGDCIRAYLQLAPEAANQHDSFAMTPFQYLCRSDIAFLEDRNFSSLMIWWYHCMPPQTETSKKRKRE